MSLDQLHMHSTILQIRHLKYESNISHQYNTLNCQMLRFSLTARSKVCKTKSEMDMVDTKGRQHMNVVTTWYFVGL